MWNEQEKHGPGMDSDLAGGYGGSSGQTLANGVLTGIARGAAGGALASALLWPGGALAHCDPGEGHYDCPTVIPVAPTDPVPGASDRLVANDIRSQTVTGADRTRVKAQLLTQRYSNKAQQRYLLVDATVRLPARSLGITGKADARNASLVLRYFRFGATEAYAECTLEPRQVSGSLATYSLGLKANAVNTLLRWGVCDDPQSPGFDSVFPLAIEGDTARLEVPGGAVIAQFAPMIAYELAMPSKLKKQPQPAVAKLLEGGSYKIKK
jgi:hypothetical protein